jgi:cell pole-organizing protein PopZ
VTTEQREQQEPSMEEILSSIRRIIADEEADDARAGDDGLGAAEAVDEHAEALGQATDEDPGDDDVLELTKVVRESGEVVDLQSERAHADPAIEEPYPAEPSYAENAGDQEIELADRAPIQDDIHRKDEPVQTEKVRISDLVSSSAATVATGAFAKLSEALQRTPQEESVADGSGRTVEQFIEDIARPMLKEWLDEHLPQVVERLVQKEIQKISRRAELN